MTLLTIQDVARMMNCSDRTVYRLIDRGRMPRPMKLITLARWRREVIEDWIARGCPDQRLKKG